MKRFFCLLLAVLTLVLSACKKNAKPQEEDSSSEKAVTLMIYMVGSDLEAKGGAGTKDLEEMLNAGADLAKNNVLVYAGGAKKWHNEHLSAEEGHTVLSLSEDGFETVSTVSEASMGDAETLSAFLNFSFENYKAREYALILWDHGNGPLIGYGKDMLHDDDSLTLPEMREALSSSPFSAENKLAFVGFDACLMSSVELACIWEPYAEYLVASQEIEPSFGWNYSFLKDLGKTDVRSLTQSIAEDYLSSCLAYYEKKKYDARDTTLACMDLSGLAEVKTALASLFSKAASDVDGAYSSLVASRINTRALGRATTGSEYDLIDLYDVAEQMKEGYPAEAKALQSAVEELVVHNATNAASCCGLSIYYPFYNKKYYERTWGEVYSLLDVLPEYEAYLDAFVSRWLSNDLVQNVAQSRVPTAVSAGEYSLELTPEQEKAYADANYYVLRREGEGIYTVVYASSSVRKSGNTLNANFDGTVLYAKNDFDEYWIPVTNEHDTVDGYTRYSAYVGLTNERALLFDAPEGYARKSANYRFQISANEKNKQIKTSALVPYDADVDAEKLLGGKLADADLSAWTTYYFPQDRHRYLSRDENGVILPLSEWVLSDYYSANVSRVGDGLEFVFAPVPDGEYYLLFQIEDVQGNRYCSETLPIRQSGGELERDFEETPVFVSWNSGKEVKLFSEEGVTVYLTTVKDYDAVRFALRVQNDNEFDVAVTDAGLSYNSSVYCEDGRAAYFIVGAGQSLIDSSGIDFGAAETLGKLGTLRSLEFSINVLPASGERTMIHQKEITVTLSPEVAALRKDAPADSFFSQAEYYKNDVRTRSLLASEQKVFEKDGLVLTLLGLGGNGDKDEKLVFTFRLENKSERQRVLTLDGVRFDGIFLSKQTGPITVLPNSTSYYIYVLPSDELNAGSVTSASSVSILVSHMAFATLQGGGGFSEVELYPVSLSQKGAAPNLSLGQKIYEENSVSLYLKKQEQDSYGRILFHCVLVNNRDEGVMLDSLDVTLNGKKVTEFAELLTPYNQVCPQKCATAFEIVYSPSSPQNQVNVTFRPLVYDIAGEKTLWESSEVLTFKYSK